MHKQNKFEQILTGCQMIKNGTWKPANKTTKIRIQDPL